MTEKVANGVLSGVVKVSGLLPGEILLASLDGFSMLIISSP